MYCKDPITPLTAVVVSFIITSPIIVCDPVSRACAVVLPFVKISSNVSAIFALLIPVICPYVSSVIFDITVPVALLVLA